MSQENLDRIRDGWDAFNQTHLASVEGMHPDIEWHTRADLADSDTYRGYEGIAKLNSDWVGTFDNPRVDIEELIDAGDRVIAVLRFSGRIRGSGQQVSMLETHLIRVLDGKIIEVHEFSTKAAALEALRLGEATQQTPGRSAA